jgi:hypothetical protein
LNHDIGVLSLRVWLSLGLNNIDADHHRIARVQLADGSLRLAELHWYEAHGLGRYEFKIKGYLD